ncbi:DNA-binding response regulator [Roseivirga sp.]|uniref:DNA-binding response regulator n=1 Tax=Roseivirga sp. TaxID=1964215 RepID=UPI003B8D11F7
MRILIIEDELIIAEALNEMLAEMGHDCLEILDNPKDAHKGIETLDFDLAILDINIAGNQEGLILGEMCTSKGIPFFFLTSYSDRETIMLAKRARPGAYLIKPFTPEEVMAAIEITLMHQSKEKPQSLGQFSDEMGLSKREADVLKYLCERLTISEITEKLFVSHNTVKFHIKNLYLKLEVTNRSEMLKKVGMK